MRIKGKSQYINLEMGFWGIVGDTGKKYLPINMPEQLKTNGARVECTARVVHGDSFVQWGDRIEIITFETLNPY